MRLIRYEPSEAQALPGGVNAFFVPVRTGNENRMTGMMLILDRKGDTGKREVPADALMTVVSGTGSVRSGGSVAELRPGDVVLLPGGISHQIWTSEGPFQAVLVTLSG